VSSISVTAIVVAAGSGRRFGGSPKQFRTLAGRPLVEWSVSALAAHAGIADVVVVVPEADVDGERGRRLRGLPGVARVVAGGPSRTQSVRRGLDAAGAAEFVLVHDAARPCVPAELIDAVIEATRCHGAAIPALAVTDTVKRVAGDTVVETVPRGALRRAQTPQGSRSDWLVAALDAALQGPVEPTDEAAALEFAGRRVAVVAGSERNVKVTTEEDLAALERRLGPGPETRIGSGYDIHRFGGDGPLVLGGVTFPGETGLAGHSDADVLLHAVMDALLGAVGDGDIGVHFPPDDPAYRGADSAALTRQVSERLATAGWLPVNVDITLLAERPRLAGRRDEIRQRVGQLLALPVDRIGLKATTLESLGALGRGEGIACQAVALVRRVSHDG
jgi:2-C-methyl-D-erythritol 4-phosphate cytidylyltransferase/2-C-methyl-D-erythritol 2,4-cyclodiphosphate synthase